MDFCRLVVSNRRDAFCRRKIGMLVLIGHFNLKSTLSVTAVNILSLKLTVEMRRVKMIKTR